RPRRHAGRRRLVCRGRGDRLRLVAGHLPQARLTKITSGPNSRSGMPSFPAPAAIRVVVEVTGTLVRVTAAERADTVVVIEPVDPVNRQHAEVAARTTAEFGAGELIVRTRRSGARTGAGSRWRGRPAV